MSRDPNPSERRAANAVAGILGGTPHPHDRVGAPPGSYDFDIELSTGATVALEVTEPEDEVVRALWDAAHVPRHPVPGLARDWWIGLPGGRRRHIGRFVSAARPLLAVLEAHGVEQVDTYSPIIDQTAVQAVVDAARSLFSFGVIRATAMRETNEPEIFFSLIGGAGGGSEQINDLVELHAGENIAKLRAATEAAERHLFVTIPVSQGSAELAMAKLPPPASPPALPEGLDVVWAANWGEHKVWRVRRGGTWEVLRAPADG